MKIIKISQDNTKKTAQDYGGYYSGDAPEYQGSMIGSPSVDLSQLSSLFGDAQRSVDLVNLFDAGLLKNIVYMFNFSKSGVYGVYVPSLDRDVKTRELSKRLEGMGYRIEEVNGMLTAHPTQGEKDPATIQQEIKSVYDDLESKGGSVLGLNVNDTRNEAEDSFNNLSESVPPEMHAELKNDLMIAHLASTIAHEATHAHGHEDEGAPTQVGESLLNYALSIIQNKFDIEGQLGIQHGSNRNWYKIAKNDSYSPLYGPSGSDLTGRYGNWDGRNEGVADFGMMAQQDQNKPIELMLGRQFMSWLPDDLDQENNVLEEQLRKYTRDDMHLDPRMIFDELLNDGRLNDDTGYKTLEELLEDGRPKPLMKPIKMASMTKTATLFGWYNNLDISDGSTIPGMGDRVMEWDDRDESFAEYESWIKDQPRYNPSYDVKGFYYRWIEPRNRPQLWDDYTRDYSNTSPAKRFASEDDLGVSINVLEKIRNAILGKRVNATRLIATEDMSPIIEKVMSHGKIKLDVFYLGENCDDTMCSYWVYGKGIKEKDIVEVEKAIQNGEDVSDKLKDLVGCQSTLGDSVEEIMQAVKEVCRDYSLKGIYALGSYAREKSFGNAFPEVNELDFSGDVPAKNLKVGYLVAQKLGVDNLKLNRSNKSVKLVYKGVRVIFSGGDKNDTITQLMMGKGMDSGSTILSDACNKDFTVNMKAYNPLDGFVYPLIDGEEGNVVKTFFDADEITTLNPFTILRALNLMMNNGSVIDSDLEKAMIKNAMLLFDGRFSDDQLTFAKNKIMSGDPDGATEAFNQFGLSKILEIGE